MKNRILKPKTIKLLRRIQKQILAEPRQFFMASFFTEELNSHLLIPNCGTAACIGGWAICLAKKVKPSVAENTWVLGNDWATAQQLLDLNSPSSNALFIFEHWPRKFRKFKKEGTAPFARQAVQRIDHFIKTDGAE